MESSIRRGFGMNVHISYKISKTSDLEKLINQQVEKLGRYLQVFRPELVHLKGSSRGKLGTRRGCGIAEPASSLGTDGGAREQRDGNGRGQGCV